MTPKDPRGDSPRSRASLVVGLGGSAGALEALEQLFSHTPPALPVAFVVTQHLDPDRRSLLPEFIARVSPLPVRRVLGDTLLEAGTVYVVEPGTAVRMDGDVLRPERLDETSRFRPIDLFFRSLAPLGARAATVLLSGAGSDGALGLQAVREAGGRGVVQAPETAQHPAMPTSALANGGADAVLPPEEIPAWVEARVRELTGRAPAAVEMLEGLRKLLPELCGALRDATGHDFSAYKQTTLLRRIDRRVRATHARTPEEYLAKLRADPAEGAALQQDLLIGVTRFFRDPEAFEALAARLGPRLEQRAAEGGTFRIWVAATSTGEEAYSIAMLVLEHARRGGKLPKVQIFATDIDASAVETARDGRYPAAAAEQLSRERLQRFFQVSRDWIEVKDEVRELCVFSQHDLLRDPPFSRVDLVSCRNVFIYFDAAAQAALLPIFHYALVPEGLLLLGPAESLPGSSELFRVLDKRHRLFQRREGVARPPLSFAVRGAQRGDTRSELVLPLAPLGRDVTRAVTTELLESHAPPAVVIDETGNILFFSGRTARFLEPPTGAPTNNLFELVRRTIRPETHALVRRVVDTNREAVHPRLVLDPAEPSALIDLVVRPLGAVVESRAYLVVFRPAQAAAPGPAVAVQSSGSAAEQLEAELRDTREHLQRTIEQATASNEELLSMNEELQSANEELQTAKEEFQSLNEELETVNAELSQKVEELDRANADLLNFFENTQVPALFLDTMLRVKKFTPAADRLFRLIPSDVGRPFTDIVSDLPPADLAGEFREVLRSLRSTERELSTHDGTRHWLMRVNPYRTPANVISGVVVAFTDVTELKRVQSREAMLAAMVESSTDAIVGRSLDGTITAWNAGAEALYLYPARDAIGKPFTMLVPPATRAEAAERVARVTAGESVSGAPGQRLRRDGTLVDVSLTLSPIRAPDGRIAGLSEIARDVTEERKAAVERARLAAIVESSDDAIIAKDLNGVVMSWNPGAERLFGYTAAEMIGVPIDRIVPEDHRQDVRRILGAIGRGEKVRHYETVRVSKDGRRIPVSLSVSPVRDASGRIIGASKIARDVSERVLAEESLRRGLQLRDEFISIASHELKTPLTSMKLRTDQVRRGIQRGDANAFAPERIERLVEQTDSQVTRLNRLVDEMLDLSRIGSKGLQLSREETDLTELVAETTAQMQHVLEKAGCQLRVELVPGVRGECDRLRLEQVVTNLLSNAARYAPGAPVTVRLTSDGAWAQLEIRDEGPGISPKDHERVFERFERATGVSPSGGFGIGLYLVKEIVEGHGGQVRLFSEPGRGATFVVKIPLAVEGPRG